MEYLYFLPVDLPLYSSQFQSVSGSDAADLKNNLRSSEFSDPTEIGGILIPFSPTLMEDVSIIISHKVGTLRL